MNNLSNNFKHTWINMFIKIYTIPVKKTNFIHSLQHPLTKRNSNIIISLPLTPFNF